MAFKTFALDEHTQVSIYKRKGAASIRLSVTSAGVIRVTIPSWTPYAAGLAFAKSRREWIKAQQKPVARLQHGQQVGKGHELQLLSSPSAKKVSSRLVNGTIVVRYPAGVLPTDESVQKIVQAASIRALRTQAERQIPPRVAELAAQHGFTYSGVGIKQLKSRWGSCDTHKHLVFNLFLMQMPWELIDYVILHELTHTQHMHHGPDFWATMERVLPDVKKRRKAMRVYQPQLQSEPVS